MVGDLEMGQTQATRRGVLQTGSVVRGVQAVAGGAGAEQGRKGVESNILNFWSQCLVFVVCTIVLGPTTKKFAD